MLRPFLVHSCFNPTLDFQVWQTQKRPKKCTCKFRVSREELNYWLGEGVLQPMVVGWNLFGEKPTPTFSENVFCFTNRAAKTPRVQTIEKAHIERSYASGAMLSEDGDWYGTQGLNERERIEVWGQLARDIITSLIVSERPDPFEGRVILFASGTENRTSLGVTVAQVSDASASE